MGDYMEQRISRIPAMALTVLLAAAACLLRANQLAVAFDPNGIMTGKGVALFTCITVIVVLLFGLYSRGLKGRKKYNAMASRSLPLMAAGCTAALLMMASGLVILVQPVQPGDKLLAVGSVLTGLCWAATAVFRGKGKKVHVGLFLLPAAFYVVDLVCRFRFWTRDPVILDYCYDLLALICVMCAVFHLGSFCFDKGTRRSAVFFSLCGVFFCAAALVGGSAASILGYGAAMIWLMTNLWLLLRPKAEKRQNQEESSLSC